MSERETGAGESGEDAETGEAFTVVAAFTIEASSHAEALETLRAALEESDLAAELAEYAIPPESDQPAAVAEHLRKGDRITTYGRQWCHKC